MKENKKRKESDLGWSPLIMQRTIEQYPEHSVIGTSYIFFLTRVTLSSSKFCVTKPARSDVRRRYIR